jgi:hypothetical protein
VCWPFKQAGKDARLFKNKKLPMSRDKTLVYSVVRLMAFVLFVGAVAVVVVAAKLGVFSNSNLDIG